MQVEGLTLKNCSSSHSHGPSAPPTRGSQALTPPVPKIGALSRGLIPSASPRTKIHKLLPFAPTTVGARPQGHRPRTGGPRAKWIDVESARPHTARNADNTDFDPLLESRRPHTSRSDKNLDSTTVRKVQTSRRHASSPKRVETTEQQDTLGRHDLRGVAALSGIASTESTRVFSKAPIPVNVPQDLLEAHGATFQSILAQKTKFLKKVPERVHPLHVVPSRKLYSDLPLGDTLKMIFGEGKQEEDWEELEHQLQSLNDGETLRANRSHGASPVRAASPSKGEHLTTPEQTLPAHSRHTQQESSYPAARRPAHDPARMASEGVIQRSRSHRLNSTGSLSRLSSVSAAASAPADLGGETPSHLEPENIESVLRGLPLVCGGRLRVSKDFAKVLKTKEPNLKARVTSALQLKAEAAQYPKPIVRQNSLAAWSAPSLSSESLGNWHAVRDLRMHHARQRKAALDAARQKFQQDALEWKDAYPLRLQETEMRYEAALDQRSLLAAAALATRARQWLHVMLRRRAEMSEQRRRQLAATVIAKKFRERMMGGYNRRFRQAILALSFRFAACIQRWRARARRKKALVIISFLQEVQGSAKLQVAVKRYRTKIVRCQTIARQYIMCNRARFRLLELQWEHVDAARIRAFIRNRAEHLHRVRRTLTPSMRLAGSKAEEQSSKMRMIAKLGGPKTLRECQDSLAVSRNKYLELFLSADMRDVPKISPAVKQRMLEMYVKKIRMLYTQEYVAYRKRLDNWNAMQQTHHSLSLVANSMISEVEGTGGETYLKNRLKEVLELESPKPPVMHMVLKREVMQQIVAKAVEHTRRLEAKQMGRGEPPRVSREASRGHPPTLRSHRESAEFGDEDNGGRGRPMNQTRKEALLRRTGTVKDVLMI